MKQRNGKAVHDACRPRGLILRDSPLLINYKFFYRRPVSQKTGTIISLINSTRGKFIDTAIFSGWLQNEDSPDFMKF